MERPHLPVVTTVGIQRLETTCEWMELIQAVPGTEQPDFRHTTHEWL